MTFTFSQNMNCGINYISFESFQNKFGRESLVLGSHRKV